MFPKNPSPRKFSNNLRRYISDAQGTATQTLNNIRTVRSFCAGPLEEEKYTGHMTKAMEVGLRSACGQGGTSFASSLLEQGASFLVLYYGGHLVFEHEGFEVGSIITFSYLWNRLSSAFQGLNDNLNQPIKAMSAICLRIAGDNTCLGIHHCHGT